MKKLVCNFKTGINKQEFDYLLIKLMGHTSDAEIALAPPFTYLDYIPDKFSRCAQDVSIYNDENAVGEVTAKILNSLETKYVIVGHSDRRNRFNESEYDFVQKINNCLNEGIKVIYCIGETREEKLRNKTLMVLERQIARVFNKIEGDVNNIILAYEPRWAISNMRNSFDDINVSEMSETILFIKKLVKDYYDINIEVLYGGSVNSINIDQYRNLQSDGLLIGQASFDADSIKRISQKM